MMNRQVERYLNSAVKQIKNVVYQVPEIEQKAMEATSNDPWGPHGSVMNELASATRRHEDRELVMSVLWKRLQDTGKNWRHVYKSLQVMEFLIGHGAENVVDELRSNMHSLHSLSDFHFVESSGKDQGINVRMKAQRIIDILNDSGKIAEARDTAAANKNKYGGLSSSEYRSGGMGGYSGGGGSGGGGGGKYGGFGSDSVRLSGGSGGKYDGFGSDDVRDSGGYNKSYRSYEDDDREDSSRGYEAAPTYAAMPSSAAASRQHAAAADDDDDDFDPRASTTTAAPAVPPPLLPPSKSAHPVVDLFSFGDDPAPAPAPTPVPVHAPATVASSPPNMFGDFVAAPTPIATTTTTAHPSSSSPSLLSFSPLAHHAPTPFNLSAPHGHHGQQAPHPPAPEDLFSNHAHNNVRPPPMTSAPLGYGGFVAAPPPPPQQQPQASFDDMFGSFAAAPQPASMGGSFTQATTATTTTSFSQQRPQGNKGKEFDVSGKGWDDVLGSGLVDLSLSNKAKQGGPMAASKRF